MKALVFLSLFFSANVFAATVVCDVTETIGDYQGTFPLKSEIKDTDTKSQIQQRGLYIPEVTIEVFACPSCSSRDGKMLPQIDIRLSASGAWATALVQATTAAATLEIPAGTVAVHCGIGQ